MMPTIVVVIIFYELDPRMMTERERWFVFHGCPPSKVADNRIDEAEVGRTPTIYHRHSALLKVSCSSVTQARL